jgi:hypothetical protein
MNIHEAELFDSTRVEYCTFWGHVVELLKFSKPSCNIQLALILIEVTKVVNSVKSRRVL